MRQVFLMISRSISKMKEVSCSLDDANRQVFNFVAILSLMREKMNIKLIVTVRDYAYSDVYDKSFRVSTSIITSWEVIDEQLKAILEPGFE